MPSVFNKFIVGKVTNNFQHGQGKDKKHVEEG